MPGVDHRLCVRHLYNNFKKKHPGLILRDTFLEDSYCNIL